MVKDKREKSTEPIKFVTEKFLYNKESNELELEFSIRNISQEGVTISSIEVENLGIFRGIMELSVRVMVEDFGDEGCLIFSKVFQKNQLNQYPFFDDNLLLPFTEGYDSYDLDPGESVLFMIKITCVRTTEDLEEKGDVFVINSPLLKVVHIFNLIAYCRCANVENTEIRHCVRSDKIYSITTLNRTTFTYIQRFGCLIRRRIYINIPKVLSSDLQLKRKEIIEYHYETVEELLNRIITEHGFYTENELFSFVNLVKKLKKLNGEVIDEYLRELSKTGDMDIQNKVSRILKAISNEPVLAEKKGKWRKFFHNGVK